MAQEIQFWDHSKRLDWFMMRAVTRKVLERPTILHDIQNWVELNRADDPSKQRSLRLWRKVLNLPLNDFVKAVLADTPEAQETRESPPPFFVLTAKERAEYIAASHKEAAVA